jgi:hypothetical protein
MGIFHNCSLLNLPIEDVIFAHILPKLEPTDWISLRSSSHQLHTLITNFISVNKVLTISKLATLTSRSFQLLTCNSNKLRHLDLHGCSWVTDDILRPVLRNNPKLISIDLSDCNNCTEGVLHTITMMCLAISKLRLRGCNWVNASGLEYLCHQHRKRNHFLPLGLEDVLKIMGTNLRTNINEKKKGKYAGKEQFYLHIKSKKMKMKEQINSRKFKQTQHYLSVLDISECDFTINDSTIEMITNTFRHLKMLNISKNVSITNQSLKAIARDLPKLETLDLSDCQHISDPGLFTVAKYCKHLKHLSIHNVTCPDILLKHIQGLGIMVGQGQGNKGTILEQRREESLIGLKTKIKSYSYCE